MKILIFSDTHLVKAFDQKIYTHLVDAINSVDKVIINGDFWDGFVILFDDFVKSKWSVLFPLLKRKSAVYIFGNHDRKEWSDNRVSQFSVSQTTEIVIKVKNFNYTVTHGNKIAPDVDEKYSIPRISIFGNIGRCYQIMGLKFWRNYMFSTYKSYNTKMEKWMRANLKPNEGLICAH